MSEFEQYALYAVTFVILLGSLGVAIWQYIRFRRRGDD